jgi:type I restriction enzyme S subunit
VKVAPLCKLFEKSDSGVWGAENDAEGISILRSTNFTQDGELDLKSITLRSVENGARITKRLRPGDILLEKSGGGPKQPVGRVALFRGDGQPHVFGNFIARLRTNAEICVPEYAFYVLRFLHDKGITTYFQKQTTGIRNLEMKRYLDFEIQVPAIAEQHRIVDILDRAANIRRLRRQAQDTARLIIPALFNMMFGDPATNRMGLPIYPLGELLADGPQNGLYRPAADYGSGTRILRIDSFYDGKITSLDDLRRVRIDGTTIEKYRLRPQDVVINRVNSRPYLGKSAIVPPMSEPVVFESNMMRMALDTAVVLPEYVMAYLQLPFARTSLVTNAKDAINQSSINQQDVTGLLVPVPPLTKQNRFVNFLRELGGTEQRQEEAARISAALTSSLQALLLG